MNQLIKLKIKMLGPIEKQIFLNEVNQMGVSAARQQIKDTPDRVPLTGDRFGYTSTACFVIKNKISFSSTDPFDRSIIDKIKKKEKKDGYIPEHIRKIN